MKPFDYQRPGSAEAATALLNNQSVALAGGTDLVTLMQNGILEPSSVVDIKRTGVSADIDVDDDFMTIGALTTISDIEHDGRVRHEFPLIAEAAQQTATRQLRNRATLGGNLLQESRCWYFRHPDLTCWLRGGTECYAKTGNHDRHAIIGKQPCITVHPSDLAGCLIALCATLEIASRAGAREVRLDEFLTTPEAEHRRLHSLQAGELITAIRIPRASPTLRSTYVKAMSRKAWSFALVGVAAAVELEQQQVASARVVLNGIAPAPMLLDGSTDSFPMKGSELVDMLVSEFEENVSPLPRNRYKVPLTCALIAEAIQSLKH